MLYHQIMNIYIIPLNMMKKIKGDFGVHHEQLFANATRENFKEPFQNGQPLDKPFNQGPKYGGATISLNNRKCLFAHVFKMEVISIVIYMFRKWKKK